jgi:alpha-glucosidase
MTDVDTPRGTDIVGRDPARAPMRWDSSEYGGFTSASPWLPLCPSPINVEDQAVDPDSTLSFYRDLIALRRRHAALRTGTYSTLVSPPSVLAWRRGDDIDIAVNLGAEESHVAIGGTVIAATQRARLGETVDSKGTPLQSGEGLMLIRR